MPGNSSPEDARRLARAVHLDVVRLDRHRWRVTGGDDPHQVTQTADGLGCDCRDAGMGRRCKHEMAVRLTLGDRDTLRGLRALVGLPERPGRAPGSRPATSGADR